MIEDFTAFDDSRTYDSTTFEKILQKYLRKSLSLYLSLIILKQAMIL